MGQSFKTKQRCQEDGAPKSGVYRLHESRFILQCSYRLRLTFANDRKIETDTFLLYIKAI